MTSLGRVVARLLILQSSWTYERMQGVGTGYASLPLLDDLRADPERHAAAVARSTELFNAHPYLAGIAVGAAARAELAGKPGTTVQRLKTALAGPLGALGDQLFWIGVVPAVMAILLLGTIVVGPGAVIVGVVGYALLRLYVTYWGVQLGFDAGVDVAAALKRSRLPERVGQVGLAAGFLVALSVPFVIRWLLVPGAASSGIAAASVGAAGGTVAALVRVRVPSARIITLATMAVVLLWYWSVS